MQSRNKHNVLLTELVIVVLFFALIAVTVIQMFAASAQRSQLNARGQRALILAQSWVERLSGLPDPAQVLVDAGFTQTDSGLYALDQGQGGFWLEARFEPEKRSQAGRLIEAELFIFDTQPQADALEEPIPLAALPMLSYIPRVEGQP